MNRIETGFRRLVMYTVGGVALLAFILFLRALFMTQSQPTGAGLLTEDDPFGVTFFTEEGDDEQPAWSPQGRTIAYVSVRDNRRYLLVRDVSTNAVTQIAEDAWNPVWSPDGTRLAYARSAGNETDLYVTDAAGSYHVKVNDVPNAGAAYWLPDGQSLVFSVRRGEGEIHIVSADGSSARTIYINGVWAFGLSGVSPDGTRAIGSGMSRESQRATGLLNVDLQTGATTPVIADDLAAHWAAWSPNGEYIAYHTSDALDSNVSILRVVAAQGGEQRTIPLLQAGQSAGQHAWSPDSRLIAYIAYPSASVLDVSEIYVAWADGSRSVPLLPASIVRTLSWSPDGAQIAVSIRNGGQFDIAIVRADEASLLARLATLEATPTPAQPPPTPFPTPTPFRYTDFYWPTRLTNDPTGNYRPAVSPDGRSVAFAADRDGNWDIYLLDRATGAETRLTDDPLNDMAPSWSPDGTRIAYQHNIPDPNGPALVERIVMNTDGAGKTVVSSGAVWIGNEAPAWSPSSDRIAFSDGKDVVVASVADRREVARFSSPEAQAYHNPVWLDNEQVVFTGDGQLIIGNAASGAVAPVDGVPGFASLPMTSSGNPRIGYFALPGPDIRLMTVYPNGAEPYTLAQFSAGLIQHAAWSPDGRFVAYYADESIHVAIAWSEQYRDNAPLFVIPTASGLTDLVGVSWLPDSSGFVFVGAMDGQPDLYLATLNQQAIKVYVDDYPRYAPTQILPLTPTPPPIPTLVFPPTRTPWAPWPTPTPFGEWLTPTPTPDFAIPTGTPPYWLLVHGQADAHQVAASGRDIWLVTPNNGAIHSADGGGTWSAAGLKVRLQNIDPSPNFTVDRSVVASGWDGVFVSTDGGTTWRGQGFPPYGAYRHAEFTDDGTVFVTSGDGYDVFQFEDGVLNWQTHQSVDGTSVALIAASPAFASDGTLYAVTGGGLWRSQDRGTSWVNVMRDVSVDLAIDPSHPSTLYVIATDNLLYQLDDYGESRIGPLMPARLSVVAVAPDGTILGGSVDGRIVESTDRGATWLEISTFSGESMRDLIATDGVIYAVTDIGLIGGYRAGAPVPATPTPSP